MNARLDIESGRKAGVTMDTLDAIAKALEVHPAKLLLRSGPEIGTVTMFTSRAAFRRATPHGRSLIRHRTIIT